MFNNDIFTQIEMTGNKICNEISHINLFFYYLDDKGQILLNLAILIQFSSKVFHRTLKQPIDQNNDCFFNVP